MIVMDPVFVPTDCCWTVKVLVVRALVACAAVSIAARLPGGQRRGVLLRHDFIWQPDSPLTTTRHSCASSRRPTTMIYTKNNAYPASTSAVMTMTAAGAPAGFGQRRRRRQRRLQYCCLCPGQAFDDGGRCCIGVLR
jgi:hypothetical protein